MFFINSIRDWAPVLGRTAPKIRAPISQWLGSDQICSTSPCLASSPAHRHLLDASTSCTLLTCFHFYERFWCRLLRRVRKKVRPLNKATQNAHYSTQFIDTHTTVTNARLGTVHGKMLLAVTRFMCVVCQVMWLQQQVAKKRVKRTSATLFNDPKWPRMWYLVSDATLLSRHLS